MKRCPKCQVDYFDNTLEFCLEDGNRLVAVADTGRGVKTANGPATTAKTVACGFTPVPDTIESVRSDEVETVAAKTNAIIPERISQSKILEVAPIAIALAHNWWQWLYLEGQYVSSIASYIFSANFLMWVFLLVAGVVVGIWAVKHSERKVVAYASLVMLAINLILFIVPRR